MPVTRETSAWSAVMGPAKWAAVLLLGVSSGAGVMYGVLRPGPTPVQVMPPTIIHPPIPSGTSADISREPIAASASRVETPQPFVASGPAPVGAAPTTSPASAPSTDVVQAPPPKIDPPATPPAAPTPIAPTPAAPPPVAPTPTPKPAPPTPAPTSPLPGSPKPAPVKAASLTKLININTATKAELELLPRVGPALAQRILDYRAQHGQFKTIEELDNVKGIGTKTMELLRPLITVGKQP
jgi:competence ComEA-like helix-hairpin-helix protein